MSGSFLAATVDHHNTQISHDRDITPYLENLASRLKNSDLFEDQVDDRNWNLINRVLAYAASAEQHIAEQKSRIKELENLSTTDELTSLNNRRALEEFLTRSIGCAKRHDEQGVVAFLDLDHFKKINDKYGHNVGDEVLKKLAEVLKENLRGTDFVARLGGDEFVFVLHKADHKCGYSRAQEIRDILCNTKIKVANKTFDLSVSMGLSKYDGKSTYSAVLNAADSAMYADKRKRKFSR
ncbi:MAG: GGDEF domain-containing protein [Sneathiella sp.]